MLSSQGVQVTHLPVNTAARVQPAGCAGCVSPSTSYLFYNATYRACAFVESGAAWARGLAAAQRWAQVATDTAHMCCLYTRVRGRMLLLPLKNSDSDLLQLG